MLVALVHQLYQTSNSRHHRQLPLMAATAAAVRVIVSQRAASPRVQLMPQRQGTLFRHPSSSNKLAWLMMTGVQEVAVAVTQAPRMTAAAAAAAAAVTLRMPMMDLAPQRCSSSRRLLKLTAAAV